MQTFAMICGDPARDVVVPEFGSASLTLSTPPKQDDDVFYLFLQKQKSAQSYIPQAYFPPHEAV
jgi:hypothetical protein